MEWFTTIVITLAVLCFNGVALQVSTRDATQVMNTTDLDAGDDSKSDLAYTGRSEGFKAMAKSSFRLKHNEKERDGGGELQQNTKLRPRGMNSMSGPPPHMDNVNGYGQDKYDNMGPPRVMGLRPGGMNGMSGSPPHLSGMRGYGQGSYDNRGPPQNVGWRARGMNGMAGPPPHLGNANAYGQGSYDDWGPPHGSMAGPPPNMGNVNGYGQSRFDNRGPPQNMVPRSRGMNGMAGLPPYMNNVNGHDRGGYDNRGPPQDMGPRSRGMNGMAGLPPNMGNVNGYGQSRFDNRGPPQNMGPRSRGMNGMAGLPLYMNNMNGHDRGGYDNRGPPQDMRRRSRAMNSMARPQPHMSNVNGNGQGKYDRGPPQDIRTMGPHGMGGPGRGGYGPPQGTDGLSPNMGDFGRNRVDGRGQEPKSYTIAIEGPQRFTNEKSRSLPNMDDMGGFGRGGRRGPPLDRAERNHFRGQIGGVHRRRVRTKGPKSRQHTRHPRHADKIHE